MSSFMRFPICATYCTLSFSAGPLLYLISPQIKPRPVHRALILPMPGTLKSGQQLMLLAGKTLYFFAVLLTGCSSHTAPLRLRFFISPHDAFCTVRTIWGGPYSTELLQTEGYFQTSLQSLLNPVFSRIAWISSTVRSYCQYLMSLTGFPFLKAPL